MEMASLSTRLGLWRVTRHPMARGLYRSLQRRGLVVAQLDRFECPADEVVATDPPPGVALDATRIGEAPVERVPSALRGAPIAPADIVIRATDRGEPVGWCCLSDRRVYVPELRRRITFEGTYLWKLYVVPAVRNRGIASALIAHAAHSRTAANGRLVALVAPDNYPSRRAFTRLGFEPTERFTSVGWRTTRLHRRRPLDG